LGSKRCPCLKLTAWGAVRLLGSALFPACSSPTHFFPASPPIATQIRKHRYRDANIKFVLHTFQNIVNDEFFWHSKSEDVEITRMYVKEPTRYLYMFTSSGSGNLGWVRLPSCLLKMGVTKCVCVFVCARVRGGEGLSDRLPLLCHFSLIVQRSGLQFVVPSHA
jgi:hypothetical protein